MKLCKILGLNVKLKNDYCKFLPMMTVKWDKKVLKCGKREVQSSRLVPQIWFSYHVLSSATSVMSLLMSVMSKDSY